MLRQSNASPYVVAGIRHHVAGGDFVESGGAGFFGGVGVEFFRKTDGVALGLGVGDDSSTIDVDTGGGFFGASTEEVEAVAWTVSLHAVF